MRKQHQDSEKKPWESLGKISDIITVVGWIKQQWKAVVAFFVMIMMGGVAVFGFKESYDSKDIRIVKLK